MGSNINSFEVFKKFTSVNTNMSVNEVSNQKNAPLTDTSVCNSDTAAKKSDFIPAVQDVSYVKTISDKTGEKKLKSRMLPNDSLTKLKVELKKAAKLPEYAYRGLKGDPNANFYEYLSLGNIPYFIGGQLLAAVFAFGKTTNNPQAAVSAVKRAKQIAVGVGLYYLGAELAKKVIDIPVKFFRGVDLNHPYENVVDCRAVSSTGYSPKKIEYHKVTESVDFTRWDLMSGDETKENGQAVNEQFDKLAKKFGIDKNVQDSDATLKGSIKKLIISSTAFKYALTAPFVALGVALAAQDAWGNIGKNFGKNIKNMFDTKSLLNLKQRVTIAGEIIKGNLITPMKESFKALWGKKGFSNNKLGKAIILTSAIAPILANLRILQLTSEKHNRFVDITEYIPLLNKKQKHS
ncbi:MAG: hypothetical protein A2104_07355 [Candidatus Melainabacteria bacterium GWF2_32_7]|nr:MAG: hypothetical protein A2104_07355 [Candidatus Melainabacteria bacterium GWF2_32_7]